MAPSTVPQPTAPRESVSCARSRQPLRWLMPTTGGTESSALPFRWKKQLTESDSLTMETVKGRLHCFLKAGCESGRYRFNDCIDLAEGFGTCLCQCYDLMLVQDVKGRNVEASGYAVTGDEVLLQRRLLLPGEIAG